MLKSRHLLGIADLEPEEIGLILDTADAMTEIAARPIKKVPTLRGRTVVNLFFEPSTRTRTSFEVAEKRLSADTLSIAVAQSSVTKGETLLDTVRNLEAMAPDMIVMRHASSGAPHLLARFGVRPTTSIDEAVDGADVIMMLRIQHERMHGHFIPSTREYFTTFGLTPERAARAKADVIIMHPGPMNRGVEIDSDVADGPYSVILEQVANGVAVRMAVLYLLAGQEAQAD